MIHNRLTDVSKLGHVLIDGKFVRIKPGDIGPASAYIDFKLTVSNDDLAWELIVRCYARALATGDAVIHCWLTRSTNLRSAFDLSLLAGGVRLVDDCKPVGRSVYGQLFFGDQPTADDLAARALDVCRQVRMNVIGL